MVVVSWKVNLKAVSSHSSAVGLLVTCCLLATFSNPVALLVLPTWTMSILRLLQGLRALANVYYIDG